MHQISSERKNILDQNEINNLREVQETEYRILLEFDRVCKKHNINYTFGGGTLLGAVRHQDFIPWDDDIDLDIKRPDFYKLIKILPQELGEEYEFINYNDFGDYFCDFIPRITYKYCDVKTSYSVNEGKNTYANDMRLNRILIELYCMHESKGGVFVKMQIFKVKVLYGLAMAHRTVPTSTLGYTTFQKISVKFLNTVGKHIQIKKIIKKYEKCVNKVKDGCGNIYFKPSVPLPVIHKNIFDKRWFDSYSNVQMHGGVFSSPEEPELVLNKLYGDWRQLPPEDSRKQSHIDLKNVKIW